jgi:histidyl-tRNA synthetase
LVIVEGLRSEGFVVDLGYTGNLQRRMRRADRIGARAAVIFGDDELASGKFTLRDFDSGLQEAMPLPDLIAKLKALA